MKSRLLLLLILCSAPWLVSADPVSVPVHDLPPNSRYAIWGDSITEVTLYPRYVEMYLLACAGRQDIKVCTFGHSGETSGALQTRTSDLEGFHPTIVSFNYGMNDTQYSPYTEEKGAAFDKSVRANLAILSDKGIKQRIVAGPGLVDDSYKSDAFFKGADAGGLTAAQAQNVTLGHFSDIGRKAAADTDSAFADIHHRMLDSYTTAKKTLGADYTFAKPGGGVHPSANGHLMIAHELLKALGNDGALGTFTVDMKSKATASTGHTVVSFSDGVLVVDSAKYPFCYNYDRANQPPDPESLASILPYLPFSQELNRFVLKVTNLDAPGANVTWGNETKSFTSDQLAAGINLAEQFEHTPFDATFAKVMSAIEDKQNFENYMIKLTANFNGNDNGGNIDSNMIAVQEQKDAAVKALLVPVRHTIVITPAGKSDAAAPILTGTMNVYPIVGHPFTYTLSALNSPISYSAKDLPKGLSLDPTTGQITGTPTEPGVSHISLSAANGSGTGNGVLTFDVGTPLPERVQITSPTTATATVGTPFSYQIVATNKPTHYFATTPSAKGTVPPASSLPPGITYDTNSGVISGTPTTAGIYPIQVAAMNDAGVTISMVTLTVAPK